MTRSKPLLLDGAMGQEIVNRGGKSDYGEWGVAALYEMPALITAIHRDYILAGADVITTNSYSTTRTRLRHTGIEDRFEELVRLAGKLAVNARDAAGRNHIQIAGSFGPLEASYISTFELSFEQMVAEFRELMMLLDPYVDIYLGETFSTTLEAQAFLTAARGRGKVTWVSWTLDDHNSDALRSAESLDTALAALADFQPDAVLLNCCMPESIDRSIAKLAAAGIPFGGYANGFIEIPDEWDSGEDVTVIETRRDLTPDVYATHVTTWLDKGASIVGGCCNIGPAHIAVMRRLIDERQGSVHE